MPGQIVKTFGTRIPRVAALRTEILCVFRTVNDIYTATHAELCAQRTGKRHNFRRAVLCQSLMHIRADFVWRIASSRYSAQAVLTRAPIQQNLPPTGLICRRCAGVGREAHAHQPISLPIRFLAKFTRVCTPAGASSGLAESNRPKSATTARKE